MCTTKVETKNNVFRIFFFSFLKHGNPDLKSYTLEAWNHLPRITNRVPLKLEFKGRATHTIWPWKEQTTWTFSALIFFVNDLWSMCTKPNPCHEIVLTKLTEGSREPAIESPGLTYKAKFSTWVVFEQAECEHETFDTFLLTLWSFPLKEIFICPSTIYI